MNPPLGEGDSLFWPAVYRLPIGCFRESTLQCTLRNSLVDAKPTRALCLVTAFFAENGEIDAVCDFISGELPILISSSLISLTSAESVASSRIQTTADSASSM